MTKREFMGRNTEKGLWNNSYRKYSKLSKYKIERILDCFARDLTVSDAWEEMRSYGNKAAFSKKTIQRKYSEFRYHLYQGAMTNFHLFGGAGAILTIGVPPIHIFEKIMGLDFSTPGANTERKQKHRPYKKKGFHIEGKYTFFCFERALRYYARHNITPPQAWVILDYSAFKLSLASKGRRDKEMSSYGFDYIAELNWSMGSIDLALREPDLWMNIENSPEFSKDSYERRLFQHLKLIIKMQALRTHFENRFDSRHKPSLSEIQDAMKMWFPNGYLVSAD